ncbi:MAG: radical SAM protein [Candidatus Omnitrophica bacterium]|nr:radical SAM protein [Candidatus Omnitrophota bacterium]
MIGEFENPASLLEKARRGEGLLPGEVLSLWSQATPADWAAVFECARVLNEQKFEKKIRFFAPLYFSSYCVNDCLYCGFRRSNRLAKRRALTCEEFLREAKFLWQEGHRSLLLIAGEHPVYAGVDRIAGYLQVLQKADLAFSVTVEVGPLDFTGYRTLKALGVDRCLLFQETYHRPSYVLVHDGPKKNFDWRLEAMERAVLAGLGKVGLGILLGLHSFREDLAGLVGHAWTFKKKFGFFPATFSFPRLQPAYGVSVPWAAQETVSDEDFEKIIAVSRLAMPSVGIVLTTRETPAMRKRLIELGIGVTHLSAGSSTQPGGYTVEPEERGGQFDLRDHRPLREVEREVSSQGYESVFHGG